jgi:predicted PurR-regulated permease PerM
MKDLYHKYGPIVTIFILIFLSYLVFKPFIITIITAAIIAYILNPVYNFILRKIKSKEVSSVLTIVLIFLIFIGPITYIITSLVSEIPGVYEGISEGLQEAGPINQFVNRLNTDLGIEINLKSIVYQVFSGIVNFFQGFLVLIPGRLVNVAIGTLFIYYFFKDGFNLIDKLTYYLPYGRRKSIIIFAEMKNMVDSIVYGQAITAVLQSIIATIGFYIIGVNSPLFFGVLILFFSVIPMLGPAIVYVPLGISMIISSMSTGLTPIWKGIVVLLYGFLIISSVDNVVKPILISDKVKLNPALIAVSMIGAISAFGIIGLVLGPLILLMLYTFFRIYEMHSGLLEKEEKLAKSRKVLKTK